MHRRLPASLPILFRRSKRASASVGALFLLCSNNAPPLSPAMVEQITGGYVVKDATGQALAYVYARETPADATKPHARQAHVQFGGVLRIWYDAGRERRIQERPAMAELKLPLSGNVSQLISPWTAWFSALGSQIGLVNIHLGQSSAPEVERDILNEVGSYGKQLGRVGDVLIVLLNHFRPRGAAQGRRRESDHGVAGNAR